MSELELPRRFADVQYREATVEHVDPDERTILLKAVPYDVETALDRDLFESFSKRCFARATKAASRTKLWYLHGGPLIGHALDVEDRDDGVWVRARFSTTINAEEARSLAGDGSLDQCSITFRPLAEFMRVNRKPDGLHVRHDRAALLGVALVPHGQYDSNAFVASVREVDADQTQREREARMARVASYTH
jgi:HK97 family phage prohead protease